MLRPRSSNYFPITDWSRRDRYIDARGYYRVFVPEHPKAVRGWYYEHRLTIEKNIGRVLESYETVHHLNEIKTDNRERNLFLCYRTEHDRAHQYLATVA